MTWQIIKLGITAIVIVVISMLSKKYTLLGSLLAALPLVSLLAMIWMHLEGQNTEVISQFSRGVFWMVLPSLPMFLILPFLIEKLNFPLAMLCGCSVTSLLYFLMMKILDMLHIQL